MLNICIIGAGPSGCVAAKKLCDEGYSVTIYEREKIPRHKHCAGYVSHRSTNMLKSINIDCSTLLSRLNGFNLICEDKFYKIDFEGLAGNVYREEFDTYLLKQAKLSDTQIHDSTIISSISKNHSDSKYVVESRDLKEEFDVIIGADGVNSYVRRYLDIRYGKKNLAITLEAEIFLNDEDFTKLNNRNMYYIGYIPNGYAWIFPKENNQTVNIGIWIPSKEVYKNKIKIKDIFKKFLLEQNWTTNENVIPHGYTIPYTGTVSNLGKDNIILIGDAAGFVGAAGEGIPYALESGIIAAESIMQYDKTGKPLIKIYTNACKKLSNEINNYHVRLNDVFFKPSIFKLIIDMAEKDEYIESLMGKLTRHSSRLDQLISELSYSKIIFALLKSLF